MSLRLVKHYSNHQCRWWTARRICVGLQSKLGVKAYLLNPRTCAKELLQHQFPHITCKFKPLSAQLKSPFAPTAGASPIRQGPALFLPSHCGLSTGLEALVVQQFTCGSCKQDRGSVEAPDNREVSAVCLSLDEPGLCMPKANSQPRSMCG